MLYSVRSEDEISTPTPTPPAIAPAVPLVNGEELLRQVRQVIQQDSNIDSDIKVTHSYS